MKSERTEGIILHTLPVKDWDLILTVFTEKFGLMKFFYRKGQSRRRNQGSATSPLTRAEFIFSRHASELAPLQEISVIDVNFELRQTFEKLESSCRWLRLIKSSQLPGKPAADLYLLLLSYLRGLSKFSDPSPLHASFHLKLLRYEGLIALNSHCAVCNQFITPIHYQGSESFCHSHAPVRAVSFSMQETEWMAQLAFCKTLKEIESLTPSKQFMEKTVNLYELIIAG